MSLSTYKSVILALGILIAPGIVNAAPPWENGEDLPDNNAQIGAKINMLKPVAVIVITKDGTEKWLFCKPNQQHCREGTPDDIAEDWEQKAVGGEWKWMKYAPKAAIDPCVIFRSTNGDEKIKCWD